MAHETSRMPACMIVEDEPDIAQLLRELLILHGVEPLWATGGGRLGDGAVDELVDRLVEQRDALSSQLERQRELVQAAAARNFDVLGELMGDG